MPLAFSGLERKLQTPYLAYQALHILTCLPLYPLAISLISIKITLSPSFSAFLFSELAWSFYWVTTLHRLQYECPSPPPAPTHLELSVHSLHGLAWPSCPFNDVFPSNICSLLGMASVLLFIPSRKLFPTPLGKLFASLPRLPQQLEQASHLTFYSNDLLTYLSYPESGGRVMSHSLLCFCFKTQVPSTIPACKECS